MTPPFASSANAADPAWRLTALAQPTNLVTGATTEQGFLVVLTNVGGAGTEGEITLTDQLPAGLSLASPVEGCGAVGRHISCEFEEVVHPGESIFKFFPVTVVGQATGSVVTNVTAVRGGEVEEAEATVETSIGAPPPNFGLLAGRPGLEATLSGPDGAPVTQAGSAPYVLFASLGFPTELIGPKPANAGHPRNVAVDLPPGFDVNPAADPRCSEVQLGEEACPPGSQVGLIGLSIPYAFVNVPLYNMLPPPGYAANLGFRVPAAAINVHLLGTLRSGDFGLSAEAGELLANQLIAGLQLQLWGDPADPLHDAARGAPVKPQARPFITLPSRCGALEFGTRAESWEEPGAIVSRSVQMRGLPGDPIEVEGCAELSVEPALSVQPSAPLADSPYGPRVTVQIPQHVGPGGSTTSDLRRAMVSSPPGMVINPSAAGGQAACSPDQIGLMSQVGEGGARFDGTVSTCPDASKLGTIEALTPLLEEEAEDGTKHPHPLAGFIYLAQPHQNPFGSLFAIYAVIEDPRRGIIAKLAGEVTADPVTGRLRVTFDEIPQLPFEEFKLDFFDGPRAALRTPAVCGSYLTRATMSPWSDTAPAEPESPLSIAVSPMGGTCATSPGELPNTPHFEAGTVQPVAGRYSPFVLNLSRDDGSQEIGAINLTLPAGLTGRLADTSRCSDAEIAAGPSCPAASRIGRVVAELGAGSSPYPVAGTVYLAGPYRDAPLSLAIVTPAVAGPFDLGTVTVRAAVSVDPTTGQISVKSDPLPTILDGVPLDLRSIHLELDKPELIRNPTSCEPVAVSGEAISTQGKVAALSSRFQVGGCASLPFKPKLSLKLAGAIGRNGHPSVQAALRLDPSGAALRSASFALPATELLDLRRVGALCPRSEPVGRCPGRSRLGSLRLRSPLLDAPLEGAVYLRAPRDRLPDLAAELRSEGLSFVLSGRTTNSGGRLGASLQALPDIPISSAILTLAGGHRGILINSSSLCRKREHVAASFSAHNGMHRTLKVPVRVQGCQ